MPVQTSLRLRRGTAAQWTSANPVLSDGEPGVESDTGNIKVGDGTTAWSSLSYALSSRYKPISGEQIWIDANAMTIYTGSPTKAASTAQLGWLLDASTDEGVEGSFMAPPSWTTFDVDCYWYNAGAGSGDVRFNFYRYRYKSATTTLNLGQLTSVTATAGTQNNTVVTRLVSGVADAWSAPGNPWWCAVMRDADNVADTLGNDMCVTGLLLTRAS